MNFFRNPYAHFDRAHIILRDELAMDRTALANERTLLAYVRTSLALLLAGVSFVYFLAGTLAFDCRNRLPAFRRWQPWASACGVYWVVRETLRLCRLASSAHCSVSGTDAPEKSCGLRISSSACSTRRSTT